MTDHLKTFLLLLASMLVSSRILVSSAESTAEDCGDVQHNVEKGMIRLPDFSGASVKDINCSWTYVAPPDRKLLVKVDSVHLPPSDWRSSSLQLYIDDQLYDIPRNCVKCLRETVGGKTIKVLFGSHVMTATESHLTNASSAEGIGSFQVRYKSFDPHRCNKADQIENGHIVSKGRKVGQSIFYRCNPPYDLFGDSEAQCIVSPETPVPEWSSKAPRCDIQDCSDQPVTREAGAGAIASPGYPSYTYQFTAPCHWVITSQLNQQIKVSIPFLKLPKQAGYENSSYLSLIDGDSTYLVNLTESITNGSLNFTTLTNRLTVQFVVSEDNKRKEEIGFYLDYSAIFSSCPKPKAPKNGDVIAYSNDLGSIVAYSCDKGFILVGEPHAECMLNGQWSHPAPSCELLTIGTPPLIMASNDSDTVTAKLSEFPLNAESEQMSSLAKSSRNGKKKGIDFASSKPSPEPFDVKENPTEPNVLEVTSSFRDDQSRSSDAKSGKKHDKEHGPKSEPHLLQVIPAKDDGKKAKSDEDHLITVAGRKTGNFSKSIDPLPDPGTGLGKKRESQNFPFMSVTMVAIIAGIGAPAVVAVILLIAIMIYRRRYPVRMRFGRKFSTFENPMYVSKDAQHPRELKRLTTT